MEVRLEAMHVLTQTLTYSFCLKRTKSLIKTR